MPGGHGARFSATGTRLDDGPGHLLSAGWAMRGWRSAGSSRSDVAAQGHERLQAHPGVGQLGRVGVAQLVRHDAQRRAVGAGQPVPGDGLSRALRMRQGPSRPSPGGGR